MTTPRIRIGWSVVAIIVGVLVGAMLATVQMVGAVACFDGVYAILAGTFRAVSGGPGQTFHSWSSMEGEMAVKIALIYAITIAAVSTLAWAVIRRCGRGTLIDAFLLGSMVTGLFVAYFSSTLMNETRNTIILNGVMTALWGGTTGLIVWWISHFGAAKRQNDPAGNG
jgi:hypothetical protein